MACSDTLPFKYRKVKQSPLIVGDKPPNTNSFPPTIQVRAAKRGCGVCELTSGCQHPVRAGSPPRACFKRSFTIAGNPAQRYGTPAEWMRMAALRSVTASAQQRFRNMQHPRRARASGALVQPP